MARRTGRIAAALLPAVALAQQIGTNTPEVHPKLPTYDCTLAGGCVLQDTSVVIDASARSVHAIYDPTISCGTYNTLNPDVCPDAAACAQNCVLEGINNYADQGMRVAGDALIMDQLRKNSDGTYSTVTPRAYLVAPDGVDYVRFQMLNREISFDVDVSKLVCGMNGALYFSEMEIDGGRDSSGGFNEAGAEYGTGYCDAQCPKLAWINGVANIDQTHGACCNEMDLWEANALAQALTPHACNITGVYQCTGADECGQPVGVCDQWGCSYNPYIQNVTDFYGPSASDTIDTSRKFTVTTQFITDDGTEDGTLTEIRRLWVQDGKVIKNAAINAGGQTVSSITDSYCASTASWFQQRGGLADMGGALSRGMVLIFSIWWDTGGFMNWLDSGNAGPCNATEGNPTLIQEEHPDVSVTFSNIRYGEIGSTYEKKCKPRKRSLE